MPEIKYKQRSKILFKTSGQILALTETNLKTKEEISIQGYTWVFKNRLHKGGIRMFIPEEKSYAEMLYVQLRLKRHQY